jgi:broad specificity phosphatase PhoE
MGTKISKHKFYFMRHGETIYNSIKDKSAKYNPLYADCHLSNEGILQSKSKQSFFNKLDIEAIYVSPYYRAIQTMQYCLETHPNADKIIAYIHPNLAELSGMMHEFILDIKETKKDFNMNSKIKVNWSIFDDYISKIKYKENLFFMNNWDLIDEKQRDEYYNKLNDLYEKGDMDLYKKEVSKIIEERFKTKLKFESYKHAYQRFIDFKNYLYEKHKNTINDKTKKIIAISHRLYISIATSKPDLILKVDNNKTSGGISPNNCELVPFLF